MFGKTGFWCLRDFDEDSDSSKSPSQWSDDSSQESDKNEEKLSSANRKFLIEMMGEIDMLRETILQLKNQLNEKTNKNVEELRALRQKMEYMEQTTNSQLLQLQLDQKMCYPHRNSFGLSPAESELFWSERDDGTLRIN